MTEGIITIKAGREKPIIQQHPWIFSGAIASAKNANPGDIVTVVSSKGDFLARGYWNPKSQIQVRILTWHDEPIDEDWWRRMLKRAIEGRDHHLRNPYNRACRLINAENDYLPGLIVDYYGHIRHTDQTWLVLQALTLGIDQRKTMLSQILTELLQLSGIYERSDVEVRGKEGLKSVTGTLWGDEPPDLLETNLDDGILYVDIKKGHKTGLYLDQQANWAILTNLVAKNYYYAGEKQYRILNLFSYTGSFGNRAASGRLKVQLVNVDSSADALAIARKFSLEKHQAEFIQSDAFDYLHDAVKRGEQFDVIVCDPPKFAHNKQQVDRATRGYKDLNLNCFKLIKPGGYLMTFSCSGAISADLFQKVVFGALADSGRQAQIIQHLGPADDHPVALTFPEGAYLKGLLLRVY